VKQPLLVIVAGAPCTGKTALGLAIADRFELPFISKDGIKEPLADVLGTEDRAMSRKLGLASYAVLYTFCEALLKAGVSHVIERNFFRGPSTEEFLALKSRYDFMPFQVQCVTETEALKARFMSRAESGERHSVHMDRDMYEEFIESLQSRGYGQLGLGGTVYEVDTTDFSRIDYYRLFAAIGDALAGR